MGFYGNKTVLVVLVSWYKEESPQGRSAHTIKVLKSLSRKPAGQRLKTHQTHQDPVGILMLDFQLLRELISTYSTGSN